MNLHVVHSTVLVALLAFTGCTSRTATTPDGTPGNNSSTADYSEKIAAAVANLSVEDQESVKQQEICPVSGEPLGSMGTPEKVAVNGRDVWICCAGCKDPLLEKPDEYLAKLK